MKEFVSAFDEIEKSDSEEEDFIEFKVDGRVMRAYTPTEGQLAFMLAALGRGQTADQRFSAIVNIMMSSLRGDDQDWLESRLLSRDPQQKMKLRQIEEIFEYLTEEWFARPTQSQSDSASSPPSDGQN